MKYIIGLLLSILIILLVIISYFTSKIEGFEGDQNKWVILLTTYVGGDEKRKQLYLDSIRKWLDNTKYYIFVVESSGYSFPEFDNENRLYVHTFQQSHIKSLTDGESNSILKILDNIHNHPKYMECKYILKVTGRYYLDGIENSLNDAPKDKDLYLQIHRYNDTKWQASEYFGIKKELLPTFMNTITSDDILEKKLYEFSSDKDFSTIGPFQNNIPGGGSKTIQPNL